MASAQDRQPKRRRPPEDEDEDSPSTLSPLNILGIIALAVGGMLAFTGFMFDTTSGSVHNIGKLTTALSLVIVGTGTAIIGAIFLASPRPPTA